MQEATDDRVRADAPRPHGSRVLVVEDDLDAAEMIAMLLQDAGHETRTVHEGISALEAARTFRPQVVLCDIGLPKMNGYELARRLRAQPEMRDARLIALSGYGASDEQGRAREAGFDYYLTKPVEPEVLEAFLSGPAPDTGGRRSSRR